MQTFHGPWVDIYHLSSSLHGLFRDLVHGLVCLDSHPSVSLNGIHHSRRIEIHIVVEVVDICHHQMAVEILTESGTFVVIL
jgi:hypothetical protein